MEPEEVVVTIIGLEFLIRATAHAIKENDEVHIRRFGHRGPVAGFCHKVDSHPHWLAHQPMSMPDIAPPWGQAPEAPSPDPASR